MKILACFLMLMGSGAAQSDDPGGWGKARWGMLNVEVLDAFDGRAEWMKNTAAPRVGIPRLELEGRPYRLVFVPDTEGRLASVIIRPAEQVDSSFRPGTKEDPPEAYRELRAGLIAKYGRPTSDTAENRGTVYTAATWVFTTTTIELQMQAHPRFGFTFVQLTYKRRAPSGL